jgi:hypothetical protein
MNPVKIKKGSQVTLPLPAGWAVTSDNPQVVSVSQTGSGVTLTGTNPGDTTLTLRPAVDLAVQLKVTVVA